MIPKIMHQIWCGDKPMPSVYKLCLDSWKKNNPTWKYILWKDKDIDNAYTVLKVYKNLPPVVKSDIARYWILWEHGGFYADVDFIFLKSFDALIHTDFVCTTAKTRKFDNEIYNGLFGVKKDCDLMYALAQDINPKKVPYGKGYEPIFDYCGPWYFTRKVSEWFKTTSDKYKVYDVKKFYPLSATEEFKSIKVTREQYPDAYTVHLWGKSWM